MTTIKESEVVASAIDSVLEYIQASPVGPAFGHLHGVLAQVGKPILAAAEAQFGEGFYVGWSDWFVKNQGQVMQGFMMLFMLIMRTWITRRSSRAEANRAMLVRQKKEDEAAAAEAAAPAPAPTPAAPVEEKEVPSATTTPRATKQRAAKTAKK